MSRNWRGALAKPQQTIREVIAIIDREALRAAFVVDPAMQLLGIVTDGDIRRGLLRGVTLDSQVAEVMNASPLVCTPATMHSPLVRSQLESQRLLLMPVVECGKLVDVINADGFGTKIRYENPVFLMAGGFGTRLRPLTDHCPKPMLKVGDKPILQIIMESLIAAGFHRFFFSTHYLPEVIQAHFGDGRDWGVSITYVHEDEPLGTGGALGLLPEDIGDEPLILMNGDLLTKVDFRQLIDFHHDRDSVATVCVREFEMQVPYGVMELEGDRLLRIREKPAYQFNVNTGIYVVSAELRRTVLRGQHIHMTTLLEQAIGRGEKVNAFPLHEYWLDIGMLKDFERAQQDVKQICE